MGRGSALFTLHYRDAIRAFVYQENNGRLFRKDSTFLLEGFQPEIQPQYLTLQCDCRRVSAVAKEAASLIANQRRRSTEAGSLNKNQAESSLADREAVLESPGGTPCSAST